VEPLNTCLKAVVQCDPQPEDFVLILGQGPIGLMFTMLVKRRGARVAATDTIPERLQVSARCGAEFTWDSTTVDVASEVKRLTGGRGADLVIVAVSARGIVDQAMACSRPGSRVLLFAQTSATERIEASGADICVGERSLLGCYSASVDLQSEAANLVFGDEIPLEELISHRLPLVKISSGIDLALHPGPKSLKIVIQPQRWS
jgi:L-iditol 2-dehydrogenase